MAPVNGRTHVSLNPKLFKSKATKCNNVKIGLIIIAFFSARLESRMSFQEFLDNGECACRTIKHMPDWTS